MFIKSVIQAVMDSGLDIWPNSHQGNRTGCMLRGIWWKFSHSQCVAVVLSPLTWPWLAVTPGMTTATNLMVKPTLGKAGPRDGKSQINQPWSLPHLWASYDERWIFLFICDRVSLSQSFCKLSCKYPNWFNYVSSPIFFSYKCNTEPLAHPCSKFLVSFKRYNHNN